MSDAPLLQIVRAGGDAVAEALHVPRDVLNMLLDDTERRLASVQKLEQEVKRLEGVVQRKEEKERSDRARQLTARTPFERVMLRYESDYLDGQEAVHGKRPTDVTMRQVFERTVLPKLCGGSNRKLLGLAETWVYGLEYVNQRAGLPFDGEKLERLVYAVAKAIKDDYEVLAAHVMKPLVQNGIMAPCVGGKFPHRCALAVILLQAQRDGKCDEVFFYAGEDGKVTLMLAHGQVKFVEPHYP